MTTTEKKKYNFFVSTALSHNTVIHSACFLATKSVVITMQTFKHDSDEVFTKTLNLSLETAKELHGELGSFIDECSAYAATEEQNTEETK